MFSCERTDWKRLSVIESMSGRKEKDRGFLKIPRWAIPGPSEWFNARS